LGESGFGHTRVDPGLYAHSWVYWRTVFQLQYSISGMATYEPPTGTKFFVIVVNANVNVEVPEATHPSCLEIGISSLSLVSNYN
jgi:hypothetical protein